MAGTRAALFSPVPRLEALALERVVSTAHPATIRAELLQKCELGIVVQILYGIITRGSLTPDLVAAFRRSEHAELLDFLDSLDIASALRGADANAGRGCG